MQSTQQRNTTALQWSAKITIKHPLHSVYMHTYIQCAYICKQAIFFTCLFMGGHHCKKWSHEAVRPCFVSIKHSVDIHKLDANYSLQVWKKKWKFAQKGCCIHAQLIFHPLREKQNVVITFKVVFVPEAKIKSRILFEKFLDLTELMRKNKNTCHFPDHSNLLNLMEGLNGSIDRLCIARLKVEHISAEKVENNFLPTWVGK